MAAHRNQHLRRSAVCVLGCLLAQVFFRSLSANSFVFAGSSLQSRLAAHRSLLLVHAQNPNTGPSLDDLFSEPDVIPSGVKGKAETVAGAFQQVDPKQTLQATSKLSKPAIDVSAYADSVGSAALTSLKTKFPDLEPQLSTVEPKQLVLALVVAAVAFLTIVFNAYSSGNTVDSTITPKASGSTNTDEPRGTSSVSSQQSELPVSTTSVPSSPSASAPVQTETPVVPPEAVTDVPEAETDVIELTDSNAVKSAGLIAFLVGCAQGGILLGGTLFIAASWVGTRRTDDFATVVKGLGRSGLKVINFGSYLDGKYMLAEQLGSGIANAAVSVKEEFKQASAVIDPATSAVGVILERKAAIKDSVDSFTTAATGAACVAGDVAVQVVDKTADALGELGKDSNQQSGGSKGV